MASSDPAIPDDDRRCAWATGPDVLRRHHDEEWGRPTAGERPIFELLTLVTFGSGLSWATVLRKREAFRSAFHGFEPGRVAAYGAADVERLLADPGIVRNRRKVEGAIRNAGATVRMRDRMGLDALVWSYADAARDGRPGPDWRPATRAEVPVAPPVARELADDLRGHGFALVGPTVAYALLQTAGVVDDHLTSCPAGGPRSRSAEGDGVPARSSASIVGREGSTFTDADRT